MSYLLALVSLLWLSTASAAGLAGLYPRTTLEHWKPRYERSTHRILHELIWPALLSEEKRRLGGSPLRLDFPLQPEGAQQFLAFYVPPSEDRIVLPVQSLKFLDDLSTAYSWLQLHGYGLETVSEYTAILRYGEAPPGGFPPPLPALGIPPDALEEPEVDELALGHFVTARTFILLHELGHLLGRSHPRTPEETLRGEIRADRFAVEVMRRIGLPPLGMLVFFLADAHWADFPASPEDTHPLSGARVRALARAVEEPGLRAGLLELGTWLDDPEIRAGFVATGKAGDLSALKPRRPGELPRLPSASTEARSPRAFSGLYRGELVQLSEPEPFPVELWLERQGQRVRGSYSFGLGLGTLAGYIEGDRLFFEWEWAANHGKGLLEAQGADTFSGTWGYEDERTGAGTWSGRRVR